MGLLLRFSQPDEPRIKTYRRRHVPTKKVVTLEFTSPAFFYAGEPLNEDGLPASKALQVVNFWNSGSHNYRFWLDPT